MFAHIFFHFVIYPIKQRFPSTFLPVSIPYYNSTP